MFILASLYIICSGWEITHPAAGCGHNIIFGISTYASLWLASTLLNHDIIGSVTSSNTNDVLENNVSTITNAALSEQQLEALVPNIVSYHAFNDLAIA